MKAALSIALAGLLVILPVEQVLAQAAQQEAVSVQQTAPADGATRLFRVPPLTQNTARLLRTPFERALVPEFLALPMTNPVDALLPTPNLGLALALNPGVDELAQVAQPPKKLADLLIWPIVVAVLVVIVVWVIVQCTNETGCGIA